MILGVQMAVSRCLHPLVKLSPSLAKSLIPLLIEQLLSASKYGDRRGAAYGLAGVVKGGGSKYLCLLNIRLLRECGIMSSLQEAIEDKKNPEKREGALIAYECLSFSLGRLFEPYIIQMIPLLLSTFGDPNKDVRDATQDGS